MQPLRVLRPKNGSPLPLGWQLRRIQQSQVLPPVPVLRYFRLSLQCPYHGALLVALESSKRLQERAAGTADGDGKPVVNGAGDFDWSTPNHPHIYGFYKQH